MINEKRRKLMATGLAAFAGGLAMPTVTTVLGATRESLTRSIPSSGERIPAVGLGTARTFDISASGEALDPLKDVVRAYIERGGTMVDSSPMYGEAERVVGELVSSLGIVDRVFFATKVWTTGEPAGKAQMEDSFRLMATDQIDLMQVHNLIDTRTQLSSIRDLVEAGRVRYIGVTHYSPSAFGDLESWIKKENLDYVQFPYSIASRQAEDRLLAAAADHGVAAIAHRNFEKGSLFRKVKGRELPDWAKDFDCATWGNFFLKYILGDPRITNVIPATTKVRHLHDNMDAGTGELPDQAMRKRMVRYIEGL
jgi:diketogulonate reductase-like aldo/keto reductase